MEKYYELTGKTKEVDLKESENIRGTMRTVKKNKSVVYQIRAISTFMCGKSEIKVGTLGGWIGSEKNLPQESFSWLDETSIVCNGATLDSESHLYDSEVQGNIRIRNSIIKNTHIYHADFNEESGLIQNSEILESNLESSVWVEHASFYKLRAQGVNECKLNILGKITLKSMYYQNLSLKGTAIIFGCNQVGEMTGNIKGGMLKNVTISGSVKMNGIFHSHDSFFKNVHFTGGEHSIKDCTIMFNHPSTFAGKSKWRDVRIRSEVGRIEADSELECVQGVSIGMFKVKAPLVMKNVKLEKETRFEVHKMSKGTVEVLGGRTKPVTAGERISGKSNPSHYGIVIDSPLLNLIDCKISGFVQVKGIWYLRRVQLSDYATIQSNGARNKLADSTMKDFSSINKIVNDSYYGKRLQLIDDNEIIV